jgi:hypothetical protein
VGPSSLSAPPTPKQLQFKAGSVDFNNVNSKEFNDFVRSTFKKHGILDKLREVTDHDGRKTLLLARASVTPQGVKLVYFPDESFQKFDKAERLAFSKLREKTRAFESQLSSEKWDKMSPQQKKAARAEQDKFKKRSFLERSEAEVAFLTTLLHSKCSILG